MPSPKTREGYTKTGKSLKAVRRYYALKAQEAAKRRDEKDEDDFSKSRRRKNSDDDKLSKRIAAELKVQQEAIERRAQALHSPTERSALPVIQRDPALVTGPAFVIEVPQKSQQSGKSLKSVKTPKSIKSMGQVQDPLLNPAGYQNQSSYSSIGFILMCLIIALVYIVTWIFMMIIDGQREFPLKEQEQSNSSMKFIRWLGIGSILVVVGVVCYFVGRVRFRWVALSTALLSLSLINLGIYLVYSIMIEGNEQASNSYIHSKNALNFWLPITYLLYHLIALSFVIKQLISVLSMRIGRPERTSTTEVEPHDRMSVYLAPR